MRPGEVAELFKQVSGLTLPEAALVFARAGVPVFPCVPDGKKPLTGHGFHDAATHLGQVASWWARWPEANLGMPTGAASGLLVVDIDRKPGGDGFGAFRAAGRAGLLGGPAGGWVAAVRTPSGGAHLYFPADPDRPQPSWQAAAAKIDLRADGGYVIVPPSRITVPAPPGTGRGPGLDAGPVAYTLAGGPRREPVPVDGARLRDFLDPRPAAIPAGRRLMPLGGEVAVSAERLAAWVGQRAEGERNRGLFWASCKLAETGASLTEVVDALTEAAERVGLSQREVQTTIRSAWRAVHAGTRPAPDAASAVRGGPLPRRMAPASTGRVLA